MYVLKLRRYQSDAKRNEICGELKGQFSIDHATLQFEKVDAAHPGDLVPANVV